MSQPTGGGNTATAKSPNQIATTLRLYNFDIDGSDLKAVHKQLLEKEVIPLLKGNPKTTVSLRGMASTSGDAAHNREPLSKARAEAVKKYLLDPKSGGKPAQITAE
jgi:outer membrane protein OmpA-like peptidoglycan-associated protein